MRLRGLACLLVPLFACSTVTVVPDDDGNGGSGSGTDAVVAASGSTSSVTTASSSTGPATSASTGGAGGDPFMGCPVVLDDPFYMSISGIGELYYWEGCFGEAFPAATYIPGGECGEGFYMTACGVQSMSSLQLFASNNASGADGALQDGISPWELTEVAFDITSVGAVGGSVRGTFAGKAINPGGEVEDVTGSFHLCRLPDALPCP